MGQTNAQLAETFQATKAAYVAARAALAAAGDLADSMTEQEHGPRPKRGAPGRRAWLRARVAIGERAGVDAALLTVVQTNSRFLEAFRAIATATAVKPEHVAMARELANLWDKATVGAHRIRLTEIALTFGE